MSLGGEKQKNQRNCASCTRNDSADDMVCCDKCERWEHYECAGVTDSIAEPECSWMCRRCSARAEDQRSNTKSVLSFNESSVSKGSKRSQARLQLSLNLLEAQRDLQRKRIEEEEEYLKRKFSLLMEMEEGTDAACSRSGVSSRANQERLQKWLEREAGAKVNSGEVATTSCQRSTTGSAGPKTEFSNDISKVLTSQSEQKTSTPLLVPTSVQTNVSIPYKSGVISSITNGGIAKVVTQSQIQNLSTVPVYSSAVASVTSSYDVFTTTNTSCHNFGSTPYSMQSAPTQIIPNIPTQSNVTVADYLRSNVPMLAYSVANRSFLPPVSAISTHSHSHPVPLVPFSCPSTIPWVESVNQPLYPSTTIMTSPYMGQSSSGLILNHTTPTVPIVSAVRTTSEIQSAIPAVGLTSAQAAARSVMSRDLPKFSGNPRDWPMFYSNYKNSTNACGYSNDENMARLQRCLEGHARESVRSRLLMPASVPHVIETLRKLYGRPELLINSLLKDVRDIPPLRGNDLKALVKYGLAVQNLIEHVIIAEQPNHLSNPILLQELIEKLPTSLQMQWGCFKLSRGEVNLVTFNEFMQGLFNVATDLTANDESHTRVDIPRKEKNRNEKLFVHSGEPVEAVTQVDENQGRKPDKTCSFCGDSKHLILACFGFKSLDLNGRWKAVNQKRLCRSCLVPHWKGACRSKRECGIDGCCIRHHPLLHYSRNALEVQAGTSMANNSSVAHQNHHFAASYTLFRYLPVTLFGNGTEIKTFAFLDDGSSSTLLEAGLAKQLGLSGKPETLWLSWTGKIDRHEKESERVHLKVGGSGWKSSFALENVRTVRNLGLPSQTLDYNNLSKVFPYLRGLPIESYTNVSPQIIIGLEHARLLTSLKVREGDGCGPIATKTRLGWCLFGRNSPMDTVVEQLHVHAEESMSNSKLHESMKRFFAIEEASVSKKLDAEVDKRAWQILESTTVLKGNQFETGLLWRTDNPCFPDSLPMAVKRFHSLEKRLAREPVLATKVREQIADYERKNYAHRATKVELETTDPSHSWYLPLGVVTTPKKPEKIRLIWDAAAKTRGISFNDMLLKGPDLLTSLPAVLLRFRQRKIAICGDICEMFHQIRIRNEDKQFQRFLWRDDPKDAVQIWVMDVATFGATCSPCSAQYIKNYNARRFENIYPRAASAVIDNHYVDDFLDSVDTVDEAVQLVEKVKSIHAAGGFKIGKFLSNAPVVLSRLGESNANRSKPFKMDGHGESERVLGMTWIPSVDAFTFDTTSMPEIRELVDTKVVPTKRQVLRTVMKLFDPLGLIAHYVIQGKVLMQDVWRSGTNWDEPIAEHLRDRWYRWIELLHQLSSVRVPRCFFGGADSTASSDIQLHVLVDASEIAYACVAYLRIRMGNEIKTALVAAKTKVAPLKPLSIPRLELQAAMIGARLAQNVCSDLSLNIQRRYLWSDSATVLAWLRSDSRRYHQFVAFRVAEILSLSCMDEWRHIPSKLNVADEATKWGSGPCFDPNSRWFQGSYFLHDTEERWPEPLKNSTATSEELRAVHLHNVKIVEQLFDPERFSKWSRMVRAMAYVHRAVTVFKKGQRMPEILQSEELQKAEMTILRQVQAQTYPDEIANLRTGNTVEKASSIYKLVPFLDEYEVVRIGSRTGAAPTIPYSARFPAILPRKHRVTVLLIDHYHREFLHGNDETVHNEIRQRYFVPRLRTTIRTVAGLCQYCKVKKAAPSSPQMAPLPKIRLTPFIRPFTYVGVDYFGPLEVKIGRNTVKRWCVVVCRVSPA
ncbi:uncharacterized protein LOC129728164 [Wyeomyia smithii]|uniref:uncharacterized protein LOC129720638 n=1 Tax=Wyeomyia smithii TaxID=174621 RepID=UPI002467D032|nr:uncharacterized protein LOC129720638 [Wyeomyia smithii]XP_055542556.1 uncharacterized protein LOC129728164 [Wyeomyia smithii]